MAMYQSSLLKEKIVIPTALVQDNNLSLSARGLLMCLLSLGENNALNLKQICETTGEKRQTVQKNLNELKRCGYIKQATQTRQNGRFSKGGYIISDSPIFINENNQYNSCGFGEKCVYLVKYDKYYKIGISTSPMTRLKEFTKLPYELEVITFGYVQDAYKEENYLHEKYADKRIRGEWFKLSSAEVEEIIGYIAEKSLLHTEN